MSEEKKTPKTKKTAEPKAPAKPTTVILEALNQKLRSLRYAAKTHRVAKMVALNGSLAQKRLSLFDATLTLKVVAS